MALVCGGRTTSLKYCLGYRGLGWESLADMPDNIFNAGYSTHPELGLIMTAGRYTGRFPDAMPTKHTVDTNMP